MMKTTTNKCKIQQLKEFKKTSDSSKEKYEHTPEDINYIYEKSGKYIATYYNWVEYGNNILIDEYLKDRKQKGKPIIPRNANMWALTNYGVRLKDIHFSSTNLYGEQFEYMVHCRSCELFGLPAYHPLSWVRMYPTSNGAINGECRFFINSRNSMRVPSNYDGCIGGFSEKIVIEAYKLEELYVPSKASIVDEYYSKTDQCYITGEIAVNPQKEHFYTSALGHAYIIYHRDGRYENNIMKASKTANQSKSDTMPEEFLPEERYKAALKSNNFGKIPETLADGRNAYAVDLVRKHIKKLIEYVNKERVHKEAKIRWIENFIR